MSETTVRAADREPAQLVYDPQADQEFWFLHWVVRLRWVLFGVVAVILGLGYNGQWRIGRDSALYREVGRNLYEGKGYTFRGEKETHIYPGMPLLLAGIDKVFGPSRDPLRPKAAQVVVLVIAGLTLVAVYHLLKLHFPRWLAVCVVFGMGVNLEFNQHAHNLMSDMSFLFGITLAMLGLGLWGRERGAAGRVFPAVLLIVGTVIALSMRPTFWAFALAGFLACVVGMFRSKRRGAYAIGLAVVVAMVVAFALLDPRGGFAAGKYEQAVMHRVRAFAENRWDQNFVHLFRRTLPEALFGFEMPWFVGVPLSLAIVAAAAWRVGRYPIWGFYILITVGMLLVLGSNSRYLLMVVPLLLAEWGLIAHWVGRRVGKAIPWRFAPDWGILLVLALATGVPMFRTAAFIRTQHSYDAQWQKRASFYDVHRDGDMRVVLDLVSRIKQYVPENGRLFSPEARIVTYLSRRNAYDADDVLGARPGKEWPGLIAKKKLTWVVWGQRYVKAERRIVECLKNGVLKVKFDPRLARQHPQSVIVVEQPKAESADPDQWRGVFLAQIWDAAAEKEQVRQKALAKKAAEAVKAQKRAARQAKLATTLPTTRQATTRQAGTRPAMHQKPAVAPKTRPTTKPAKGAAKPAVKRAKPLPVEKLPGLKLPEKHAG